MHTPGPWTAQNFPNRLTAHVYGGDGVTHTVTHIATIQPEDDNNAAVAVARDNARLIAAAPELLAALLDLEFAARGQHEPIPVLRSAIVSAREAITKATTA